MNHKAAGEIWRPKNTEMEKLIDALEGRSYDVDEHGWIYGYEPYFKCRVKVAKISNKKEVHFCAGYFPPHSHGVAIKGICKRHKIEINE